MTGHAHGGADVAMFGALLLAGLAALAYLAAARRSGVRRRWPWYRSAAWSGGLLAVSAGLVGPLAAAAEHSFVAHAAAHVLFGMLGPLLLVCGAPVTLALRTLPVPAGRRLSRVLASWPIRIASEPSVAATLSVGGLWLLYATPLFGLMEHRPVHVLVHLHVLLAGYLLAASLVGTDPMPHRRSYAHRAAVLVAAVAGHDILAKYLFTHPPVGVAAPAAELGAMVMYYGGDAVELVVMVLLCRRWFARPAPRPRLRTA